MNVYAKIKQLRGKKNNRIDEVLAYIAKKEGYISGEKVQYKKLYDNVLKARFEAASNKAIFGNRAVTISVRQYKRLRRYAKGMFSINIAVYLLALYDLMRSYGENTNLLPRIDNITYTQYVVDELQYQLVIIIQVLNENNGNISQEEYEIYEKIYNDLIDIDNTIGDKGRNSFKIYNNIW